MDNNNNPLAYRNEDDRCYGLAGMVISLGALDAVDRVVRVSLDSDGPMVTFSTDFFYGGSPDVSPKATWRRLMENYHITASLAVSNIMARAIVRDRSADLMGMLDTLKPVIESEGATVCQLEEDEISNLYNNILNSSRRIFLNPRVQPAVDALVRMLARRRTLSGREIAEELYALRLF